MSYERPVSSAVDFSTGQTYTRPASSAVTFEFLPAGGTSAALQAAVSVVSTASSQLTTEIGLSASAAGVASASGAATTAIQLAGTAAVVAAASSQLTTAILLGSSSTAQTNTVLAMLNTGIPLVGAATAAASVTAAVSTAIRLNATVVAETLVTGAELAALVKFATAVVIEASATSELSVPIYFAASVSALTTASSDLTTYSSGSRPAADITTTGWVPSTGTSLFDVVNEGVPDDADYASNPSVGLNPTPLTLGLDTPVQPENLVVRIRARGKSEFEQLRAVMLDDDNTVVGTSVWHTLTPQFQQYNLQIYTAKLSTRVRVEVRADGFADMPPNALFLGNFPVHLGNDAVSLT